jgi:hypothetical protein
MAAVKVKISRLTVEEIEVEVPSICTNPKCAADLTEPGSMRECAYMCVDQTCCVDLEGGRIDSGEETRDHYEIQHTIGYQCVACGEILVGEEA